MKKSRILPNRSLVPLSLLASPLLLCASALAQPLLFEARFNDPSKAELLNGATLGPERSGVSGKPQDLSCLIDLSYYTGGVGPAVNPTTPRSDLSGIEELTVTGWYKATGEIKNDATLFSAINTQLMWEQSSGRWVWRVNAQPTNPMAKTMNWFKSGIPAPLGSWVNPGEWIFISMVWKRADNSVEFFQGSTAVPAALAGKKGVRPEAVEPLSEAAKTPRSIGNDASKKERPFQGNIDNLRFFSKALDLQAIELIRQADVKNEAPPLN